MIRKLGLYLVSAVAGVCVMGSAQAMPTALITGSVNNNVRATLSGNTRPEAISANDRGAVSDHFVVQHAQMLLRRSAASEAELVTLIANLHDRKSPLYHKWLTAKEFGERFGASDSDIAKISGWLSASGLKIDNVATGKMMITFSGTAGDVRTAFHTEIHNLSVDGQHHVANMSDPQIPAAFSRAVVGIVSLNDFKPHTNYVPRRNGNGHGNFTGNCTVSGGPCLAVTPADLATIYDQNPLLANGITGNGVTVVVIEDTGIGDGATQTKSDADWLTFRKTTGLNVYTHAAFQQIQPQPASGSADCADPGINGDEGEATLDAEWASAAAPDAHILMASCADTLTFGGLIALENLLNGPNPAPVVSISYGECETRSGAAANAAFNTTYQQAVAEGTTVFVSSGDQGAAVCDRAAFARHGIGANGWGGSVYNVSVGGTDFGDVPSMCTIADLQTLAGTQKCVKKYWNKTNSATFGSAKSYIPEIPWDDSCANSTLAAFVTGSAVSYGSSGFCNTAEGRNFLETTGGSGGPSGCATGAPGRFEVVSGGCQGYKKPTWQAVFGNPADGVRDLPDVSLFAANGLWTHSFVFCDSNDGGCTPGNPGAWDLAGGTSFSSPIMAGFMALVVQKTGSHQGDANINLYALANTEYGTSGNKGCNSALGGKVGATCVFHDVTVGDIDVNCRGNVNCYDPSGINGVLSVSSSSFEPAYKTGPGWDFATGLGTVDVKNLVNGWPT
jgi:subtilase family serine protease